MRRDQPRPIELRAWLTPGPWEATHLMTEEGLGACTGQLVSSMSGNLNFVNCPTCRGLAAGQLTLPLVAL
jgi:hypothetical protein